MSEERFFKVLIVGATKSGKSSIINYSVNSRFEQNIEPTIGADFSTKQMGKIKVQFWDLAGPERFQNMSKVYFDNSKACIMVIDNTDIDTFDTHGWRDCIKNWERENGQQIGSYLIALNKVDHEEEAVIQNGVIKDTPLEWAIDHKIPVIKTSAKTGRGIRALLRLLVNILIQKEGLPQEPLNVNDENILYIPDSWDVQKRKQLQLSASKEDIAVKPIRKHLNDQALKQLHKNFERLNKIQTFERANPSERASKKDGDEPKSMVSKESIKKEVRDSNKKDSSSKLGRGGFREQTIDHYCPPSESDKIKNITELNFELLLKIIRSNITEEGKLKPDKLTQYFIAYNIFNKFKMDSDSIRCLEQIISLAEETGSQEWISYALNSSAEILKNKGEYDAAIHYYKNALEIDRELDDPEAIANELHNIASIYYNQENYSKALNFFKQALQIDKELNILSNQANRQWWIGSVFSKINKTQNALTYLKKALHLYNQLGCSEEAEEIQSVINNIQTVHNKT